MKKRTLAAAGLAMIMAVSLAGCSTTVSVPDTVKVENVGDSSDGKITMDSSETVKIVPDMAKIVFAVTSVLRSRSAAPPREGLQRRLRGRSRGPNSR